MSKVQFGQMQARKKTMSEFLKYFPDRPKKYPQIYAYSDTKFTGLLKIGYTERQNVEERISEQYKIKTPYKPYRIELSTSAMRNDGTTFTDKDIHRLLKTKGFVQSKDQDGKFTEWFKCNVNDVKAAVLAVKNYDLNSENRVFDFKMRQEQKDAVNVTAEYFNKNKSKKSHFLWNCKMRFGKTFATYHLAKKIDARKVLILTFKPAVEKQWKEDLLLHKEFEGWQFSSKKSNLFEKIDKKNNFVVFGSLQDYLGKSKSGGIKITNQEIHEIEWDLIVLDEYHFGAWNENTQRLIFDGDESERNQVKELNETLKEDGYDSDLIKEWNENALVCKKYLYLSGTPFKAIASGDFAENQIFNWTYGDEQNAKTYFIENKIKDNPYLELPEIIFLTYEMPKDIKNVLENKDGFEFSLGEFFKASGKGKDAKFKYENEVQKWLNVIRGKTSIISGDLKDKNNIPLPFEDVNLLNICNHQMWYLSDVASCDAMFNLLKMNQNSFYHSYKILNISGKSVGTGIEALEPVESSMGDRSNDSETSRSIILTCGKLTTGVTIRPLSAIFMLSNLSSPETYFQTAFRVQSPWTTINEKNEKVILKEKCFIFDFAPNRALNLIVEYANKLDTNIYKNTIQKVEDFINFLPILQFDGNIMKRVDAKEIIEFVDTGTNSTLLARRWNSATLVNVDNVTLNRILNNPKAMEVIESIEGWRAELGDKIIQKIVSSSKKINLLKTKGDRINSIEKKALTDEQKKYRDNRKKVQEKLIKFATRIPIFMYLTDYREASLLDIIRKLDNQLFKKVTGLSIEDFELLLSVGVFNNEKMNSAIAKFRDFETPSLSYVGVDKHSEDEFIGLFDTKITKEDKKILSNKR